MHTIVIAQNIAYNQIVSQQIVCGKHHYALNLVALMQHKIIVTIYLAVLTIIILAALSHSVQIIV